MKLNLAMSEIKRWSDMYCENAIIHVLNGDIVQSELCRKIANELDHVLQIVSAINDIDQENDATNRWIHEYMMQEASERLKLLDWPVTNMIVDAIDSNT